MRRVSILYLLRNQPFVFEQRNGYWLANKRSFDQIQPGYYLILLDSLQSLPLALGVGQRIIPYKIATITDVCLHLNKHHSPVIFVLKEESFVTLMVLHQEQCLLQRFLSSPNLVREIDRTCLFLKRYHIHPHEVSIFPVKLETILDGLITLPQVWGTAEHPLKRYQWLTFWCRWLPRLGLGIGGALGMYLCSNIKYLWQIHHLHQELTQQVIQLSPLPRKAKQFGLYRTMKKGFPVIDQYLKPLQDAVKGHWVADEIEWQQNHLRIRFQVDPKFSKDIHLKQQDINQCYINPLKWTIEHGEQTFVHLSLPLS